MKRALLVTLAALALFAAGWVAGWFAHKPRLNARLYAQSRFTVVQQHLDEAEPGYILLAGDSQAELQSPSQRICDAPVVNAGLSGATSAVYADLFPRLSVPVHPRAAVLTIGTNNMNRKNEPLSPGTLKQFEIEVSVTVARLRSLTDTVVVTAVPPLGPGLADRFDGAAVEASSERIKALCAREGCLYADPFAALRDRTSGYGLPGANKDELHLARYRPTLKRLENLLCPERASANSLAPSEAPGR